MARLHEPVYPSNVPAPRGGNVKLLIRVNAWGGASEVTVLEGLGEPWDEAAREAMRLSLFDPATRCGREVPGDLTLVVHFASAAGEAPRPVPAPAP